MAAKKQGSGIFVFGYVKIKKGQVCVLVIPHESYNKHIVNLTKEASKAYGSICYATLNKPYNLLLKTFKENNIDPANFYFIDPATKSAVTNIFPKNVIPVESVSSITSLSIAISNVLEKKKAEGLILDSISTMLIYNNSASITKFMHFLVGKIKTLGCTGILTILEKDSDSSLMQDIGMFADNVIYLGKKQKKEKA